MLKSMTGYGLAKGQHEGLNISVEIRTLNSKFLDAQIRLPKNFQDKELEVRNRLTQDLIRGKVSVNIEVVNENISKFYQKDTLEQISNELKTMFD